MRDYRNTKDGSQESSIPPPTFHDDEPLPTHAYMTGMEAYEQDAAAGLPLWQRRAMREQGLLTTQELDIVGIWMRRGITEL